MNWNKIEGCWKQFRGMLRERWGKLSQHEPDITAGKRDQLVGRLQRTYGTAQLQHDSSAHVLDTTTDA